MKVEYGKRDDGSMWLSIGEHGAGEHFQGDWYFGQEWANRLACFDGMLTLLKQLAELHDDCSCDDINQAVIDSRAQCLHCKIYAAIEHAEAKP